MHSHKLFAILLLSSLTNIAYANNIEASLPIKISSITKLKIKQEIIDWSNNHNITRTRNRIKVILPEKMNTIKKCEQGFSIKKIKGQGNISRQMYFNVFCQIPKWKLTYKTNISLDAELPILKKSIHKGDKLLSDNIKLKWFNITFFERDIATSSAYLIKKEATRYIAKNTIISNYQVQETILIHAGDLIRIKAGNVNFNVEIDGIALTSGGLNKPIKVKTLSSHKQFIAYPASKGVVTVK